MGMAWQVLYWLWIASEIVTLVTTRTRSGGGDVRDRGSLRVLWLVIASSIFVSEWTAGVGIGRLHAGVHAMRVAALVALVLGLAIRWSAIATLGKAFSANVAIRPAQAIRTTGLYRFVRHPSYLGLLLVFLAIGLHTRSWMGLGVMAICPTAALLYRIRVEEDALSRAFGEEYERYSRRTRRLVPGVF